MVIDTQLDISLEPLRNPHTRLSALNSYSASMAYALKKKPQAVRFTEGIANPEMALLYSVGAGHITLSSGEALCEEYENGEAALYGAVAIAYLGSGCARGIEMNIRTTVSNELLGVWRNGALPKHPIALLARTLDLMSNYAKIQDSFGGIGGAIPTALLGGGPKLELLEADNNAQRFQAIVECVIYEMFAPLPDYPGCELIREWGKSIVVSPLGTVVCYGVGKLRPLFLEEPEQDKPTPIPTIGDTYDTITPLAVVPEPRNRPYRVMGKQSVLLTAHPDSQWASQLLDMRYDITSGHYSGQVGNQLERLFTDGRIMRKRARVIEPPDAIVVCMLDASGSMRSNNHTVGMSRGAHAQLLHDKMAASLKLLDVGFISAAYASPDDRQEFIVPINAEGDYNGAPPSYHSIGSGNADYAALQWAATQVRESNKELGVIVFLADGEFTNITPAEMSHFAKLNNQILVHVDYAPKAERVDFADFTLMPKDAAQQLPAILATALGL